MKAAPKEPICVLSHIPQQKNQTLICCALNSEGVLMSNLSELRVKNSARWSWLVAAKDSDLTAVAIFCAILLATLNLILRFPDLGAIIAQSNQF
jgi:hypothetical protein